MSTISWAAFLLVQLAQALLAPVKSPHRERVIFPSIHLFLFPFMFLPLDCYLILLKLKCYMYVVCWAILHFFLNKIYLSKKLKLVVMDSRPLGIAGLALEVLIRLKNCRKQCNKTLFNQTNKQTELTTKVSWLFYILVYPSDVLCQRVITLCHISMSFNFINSTVRCSNK